MRSPLVRYKLLFRPSRSATLSRVTMNSEYLSQLTDDQNNSCDSDYEFINNTSSHDDSDCEPDGYKKFQSVLVDIPASTASPRFGRQFESNQSEKLNLSLSAEKIALPTNSPRHTNPPSANQGQKIIKNRPVPSFTIVPINLNRSAAKETGNDRNDSKASLPEIVLTSFEVAAAGKKTPIPSTMDAKLTNGCIQTTAQVEAIPSSIGFQQDDKSPSPESYLDTQLSAASSLSNRSSENSSDIAKSLNSTSEVVHLHRQAKSDIDCIGIVQSSVAPTAVVNGVPVPVPDELQCGICHGIYKDPRTLFCLHSFCFQCLVDENFKQDSSIPFWSQPDQKDFDWKTATKTTYSIRSMSAESSPEMSYRHGSSGSTRLESRSSFASFRSKKSFDKLIKKDKSNKKKETSSPPDDRTCFIICKECQQPTEVPIGGIRQLPHNFILSRKIELFKMDIGEDVISKVWCSLCYEESNAVYHCLTCTINLCTFCKEAHERQKHTANHKIKNILDLRTARRGKKTLLREGRIPVKCSMHPGYEMKSFCSSCLQVACADCIVLLHKGHKYEPITKALNSYQKIIKESTDQARPLCDYTQHSISRLNEIAKKINRKCDNVQSDVESFMAAYTQAVELHGRTLMQQINRARESKIHMIVEQQLDMEKKSAETLEAIRFSEDLINSGSDVEILSFVNVLLRRFEYCQKFNPPVDPKISDTLHFLPEVRAPTSKNQRNIPIFGIITTQTVEPTLCTLESEGFTQLRVHRKVEMVVLSRDADGIPLCHGGLKLNAQLKYKESSSKYLPVEVSDRRDGSYGVAFVPDSQGTMTLTILINDKHIKGSPFTFAARTVRPHAGIYHCCAFCSSKGSKQATCSCEGRMPGYGGCGHGHNGHPGRRHWSCCGNILENSECSAANKLLNP